MMFAINSFDKKDKLMSCMSVSLSFNSCNDLYFRSVKLFIVKKCTIISSDVLYYLMKRLYLDKNLYILCSLS